MVKIRNHYRGKKTIFLLLAVSLSIVGLNFKAVNAAAAGQNGKLLFVTTDSPSEIHTINFDSGNLHETAIAKDSITSYYNALYSPDGTKIVYLEAVAPTILDITKYDGTLISRFDATPFYGTVSWHPNGEKFVVTAQNGTSYFNMYTADTNNNLVNQLTNYNHYVFNPRYSPDGTKIVYQDDSDTQIYVMNANGTSPVNLTGTFYDNAVNPSWSPDGTKIIFSHDDGSGNQRIGIMNPDGSGKTNVGSTLIQGNPIYSPDGTKIAYIDTSNNLHIMNTDATGDAIWAHNVATVSWQPLTLGPASSNPNPTISLNNLKATVDIPSLFTDPYGTGVSKSSVSITSAPKYGSSSVDPSTGIATYSYNKAVSHSNLLSGLANLFFAKTFAASTDSFSYRICSQTSSSLCSTGTVTVSLLGVPDTGYTSDKNPLPSVLLITGVCLLAVGLYRKYQSRRA